MQKNLEIHLSLLGLVSLESVILVSKSVIMQRNSAKERIQISNPGVEEGDVLDTVEQVIICKSIHRMTSYGVGRCWL